MKQGYKTKPRESGGKVSTSEATDSREDGRVAAQRRRVTQKQTSSVNEPEEAPGS